MEKKPISNPEIRRYWFGQKGVFASAIDFAFKESRMKTPLLYFVIAILIVLITGIGNQYGILPIQTFWNSVERLNVGLTPLTVSAILFLTFFIALLYRTPAEIHKEQSDHIEELKDKWEPKQINLEIEKFRDTQKKIVGLAIKNPISQEIDHLSIQLNKLIYVFPSRKGKPRERVPNDFNRTDPRFLEGVFKKPNAILPLGEVRIFVAKVEEETNRTEKIVFKMKEPEDISIFDSVADDTGKISDVAGFEIELQIDGILNRLPIPKPIQTQIVEAYIHYEHRIAQITQRGDEQSTFVRPTPSILIIEILKNEQKM